MRGCPKPLREPDRYHRDGRPSSCPVLDVPEWYWMMRETGAMIERGAVSVDAVTSDVWELARTVYAADAAAEQRQRWIDERKRKAMKQVLGG